MPSVYDLKPRFQELLRRPMAGLHGAGISANAVTVAALNVYDMLKAASKAIEIGGVRLLAKSGGKSGDYRAQEESGE